MVEDARQHPTFSKMAATQDSNIGSYIGVPIRFSNGQIVGTLCGLDPETRTFSADQIHFLQVLARFMAALLEKDVGLVPKFLPPGLQSRRDAPPKLPSVVPDRPGTLPLPARPALPDTAAPARTGSGPVAQPAKTKKGTALLIDGTVQGRQPLAQVLEGTGYTVFEIKKTCSADRIIKEVRSLNPTLVILVADELLEESLEAVRQIRQHRAYLSLPFYFIDQRRTSSIKAYMAGATRFLLYMNSKDDLQLLLRE